MGSAVISEAESELYHDSAAGRVLTPPRGEPLPPSPDFPETGGEVHVLQLVTSLFFLDFLWHKML